MVGRARGRVAELAAITARDDFDTAELYAACGSDDPETQTAAYRTLWAYLLRVTGSMTARQPDGAALAQECAQRALIRVHERLAECREPRAFRAWARRIASRLVIDELRRRKRLAPLPEPGSSNDAAPGGDLPAPDPAPEALTLDTLTTEALRALLLQAPMSERSRRVVIGRFLDDHDDDELAQAEEALASQPVRPSHVQVTRAKNIAKLRRWPLLRDYLGLAERTDAG